MDNALDSEMREEADIETLKTVNPDFSEEFDTELLIEIGAEVLKVLDPKLIDSEGLIILDPDVFGRLDPKMLEGLD